MDVSIDRKQAELLAKMCKKMGMDEIWLVSDGDKLIAKVVTPDHVAMFIVELDTKGDNGTMMLNAEWFSDSIVSSKGETAPVKITMSHSMDGDVENYVFAMKAGRWAFNDVQQWNHNPPTAPRINPPETLKLRIKNRDFQGIFKAFMDRGDGEVRFIGQHRRLTMISPSDENKKLEIFGNDITPFLEIDGYASSRYDLRYLCHEFLKSLPPSSEISMEFGSDYPTVVTTEVHGARIKYLQAPWIED